MMNNKRITLLFLCLALSSAPALAATKSSPKSTASAGSSSGGGLRGSGTGLGLMLGEPTGITLKSWLSSSSAFDVDVAYSFDDYVAVMADYLFEFPGAFKGSSFVPYVGVGLAAFVDTYRGPYYYYHAGWWGYYDHRSSFALGARVPLGIEFLPRSAPLGIFAELAPGVAVGSGLFGFFQASIGLRMYL